MPHKSPIFAILLLAFFLLLPPISQAETDTDGESNKKQQLRSLLQKLDQSAQQRQQQDTQVDELSRRLECNWTLIRAYEICGQLHQNDPDGHLQCSAHAKQNSVRCLEDKTAKK